MQDKKEGQQGPPGNGFELTEDGEYDMKNKILRNTKDPIESSDASTKRYVDKLKRKSTAEWGCFQRSSEKINTLEDSLTLKSDKYDGKGKIISNIEDPIDKDVVTKAHLDYHCILWENGHYFARNELISGIKDPVGDSDAVNKKYFKNKLALDPQAIQRAAANLPSHVFNALSQVAGQTPGAFQGANAFAPGYSGGYNYQPYTPSQPVATPMAITPSYHAVPTPAHSQVPTPRYSQTPQQNWSHPAAQTPSRSTPKTTGVTTQDWRRMAEQWAQKSKENMGQSQMTPRTPVRGSPSPMVIESTPADATPLIDEF
ncbi:transcription elongation factor spt6 [Trichonephila clavipes]|nr:transcription elongation factor spt6 [Trichonephila clavipes]